MEFSRVTTASSVGEEPRNTTGCSVNAGNSRAARYELRSWNPSKSAACKHQGVRLSGRPMNSVQLADAHQIGADDGVPANVHLKIGEQPLQEGIPAGGDDAVNHGICERRQPGTKRWIIRFGVIAIANKASYLDLQGGLGIDDASHAQSVVMHPGATSATARQCLRKCCRLNRELRVGGCRIIRKWQPIGLGQLPEHVRPTGKIQVSLGQPRTDEQDGRGLEARQVLEQRGV